MRLDNQFLDPIDRPTHVLECLDVVDEDVLVAPDEGAEELAEPVQLVQALKREKEESYRFHEF